MPMINGMFTNLPDDYNRGYSPVPQNYGLAMAVENLRGDNQTLPQSFNDKLNSIAEASLKAAQLKGTMNQQPQEDLRSNLQKRLNERKARAIGMSELLKNRTNDEFNKRLYDSYIESKLGPVSKKEDFNGLFSPIPQSLPPPETKTRNTTEPQYTPIPDSYKALLEKDKQSEQPVKAKSAEAKPSASAPDRSKDFIERYREAARNATMELDPVSFQSNINVAMRDPVYGNATATGLATGQNLLNSWIAGNNAKARRDKEALSDMRWIKQMEDAEEDRKLRKEDRDLRRQELAEAKKRYLPGVSELEDSFLSPEDQNTLGTMNKNLSQGRTFDNLIAYEQAADAQRRAIEERQKFLDSRRRNLNITGEALDAAGATKGMTKEEAMNKYGTQFHDSSWRPKFLGGTTKLEDSVSKLFKDIYKDPRFNRMTPTQYINRFEAIGNQRGADKIRAIVGSLARDGYHIDEVLSGVRPEDPVYFRIGSELKLLEPNTMTLKDIFLR